MKLKILKSLLYSLIFSFGAFVGAYIIQYLEYKDYAKSIILK